MGKWGSGIKIVLDRLSLAMTVIAAAALVLIMLAMALDAAARKVVGSVPGAYEFSIGLMVLVMFLPQAYAQMRGSHVAVDILTSRLSPKMQAILDAFGAFLGALVLGLLTYVSFGKAWECTLAREIIPGMTFYPMWPFRWFVPLGSGLLTLQFLGTTVERLSRARKGR